MCESPPQGIEFIDHEDYLAVSTNEKYSQLLVPESGDPNFDTYESQQFQTKK